MSEDEEHNKSEDENVDPTPEVGSSEESKPESSTPGGDSDEESKEPEDQEMIGKINPEDVSEEDAEAAMLAMMEGKEVGEGGAKDSSFDDKLAGLPDADKISADAIDYGDTVARPADFQQLSARPPSEDKRPIDMLLDVSLPISIELGRTRMTIADILALGPGSVVELNKLAGEPVEVLVNQKTVALGEVVVVDENFGVRVTQLMSPEDRLKALQV